MATPGFRGSGRVSASHASIDFCNPPERVKRYEYDYKTGQWSTEEIRVRLSSQPFQQGTLRYIYYMIDLSKPEGQQEYVAKLCKNVREPSEVYFQDVVMHGTAKCFAEEFNAANPPKKVDFILPVVMEFTMRRSLNGRDGHMYMNVEPLMKGAYKKYSNNFGFVSPEERNTPHAFSHFTYHASGGKMLVCDIQGVNDMYTDPQIHSIDCMRRWGKGDMGMQGMMKFFSTHRCSSICEFLGLPRPNKARGNFGNSMIFTPPMVAPNFTPKIHKTLRDRHMQGPQLPPGAMHLRQPGPSPQHPPPVAIVNRGLSSDACQVNTRRSSESSDSHPSSGHVSSGSNSAVDSPNLGVKVVPALVPVSIPPPAVRMRATPLPASPSMHLPASPSVHLPASTSMPHPAPTSTPHPAPTSMPRPVPGGYQSQTIKPSTSIPVPRPPPNAAMSAAARRSCSVPFAGDGISGGVNPTSAPIPNIVKTPVRAGMPDERARTPLHQAPSKMQYVPSKVPAARPVSSKATAF